MAQQPASKWRGRDLKNYKSMHAELAKEKGVAKEFEAAKTLTEARKILFGSAKGGDR